MVRKQTYAFRPPQTTPPLARGLPPVGLRVVVDGNVHMATDGLFNTGAGTTAAGKQVHHQLGGEGKNKLGCKHSEGEKLPAVIAQGGL